MRTIYHKGSLGPSSSVHVTWGTAFGAAEASLLYSVLLRPGSDSTFLCCLCLPVRVVCSCGLFVCLSVFVVAVVRTSVLCGFLFGVGPRRHGRMRGRSANSRAVNVRPSMPGRSAPARASGFGSRIQRSCELNSTDQHSTRSRLSLHSTRSRLITTQTNRAQYS